MDEIGFCGRCEVTYWVIAMDVEKKTLLSNPDNSEFLIVCKSISGGGIEILPMLILSSVQSGTRSHRPEANLPHLNLEVNMFTKW